MPGWRNEDSPEKGSVPLQTSKWPTVKKVGAMRSAMAAGEPSAVWLAEAQTAPVADTKQYNSKAALV